MYSKVLRALDDILALAGFTCLLSGVYLWFGLPPMLILLGLTLIYTGARIRVGANP